MENGTCSAALSGDPHLGPLADNGSSTQTFALLVGSPTIDAGANIYCPAADQRGVARPQDGNGDSSAVCDIGSYECQESNPLSLLSFMRFNPPGSPTNASTLVFRASFSKDVQNVDAADFTLNATPATTATITAVTQVSPSLYEITVSGGDLATFNGIVQLAIAAGQNITDLAGNPLSPSSADETYLVQHIPPFSPPAVGSVAAPGPGTLLQGQTLASDLSQFTVVFSQNVTAASAQNTANYLLVRAGGNGVQTLSYAGGVSGGDTAISINSAVYAPATYTVTLNVNGGQPLPAGLYRLFVCSTTSIVNASGEELYAGLTNYGLLFNLADSAAGGGSSSSGTSSGAAQLPATGFAFGRVTSLPPQPLDKAYSSTDLILEIPSLGVKAPIVGVLKSGDSWDVSWLGNTVLTAHVWNADNTPGVFAALKDLKYGDHFTIRASG